MQMVRTQVLANYEVLSIFYKSIYNCLELKLNINFYVLLRRQIAIRCNMYILYQGKMSDKQVGGCFYSYWTG